MNWHDLVPRDIAISQERWERYAIAKRMFDAGLTKAEVGRRLGVGREQGRQLVRRAVEKTQQLSPVEKYCADGAVALAIKELGRRAHHAS